METAVKAKANYYDDNPDLRFVLDHFVDWAAIVTLKERGYADAGRDTCGGSATHAPDHLAPDNLNEALAGYRSIHEQYGGFAGAEIAPLANAMNAEGLEFESGRVTFPSDMLRLIDRLVEAGLVGYGVPREYGGRNLPLSAQCPVFEMLYRADLSFGIAASCFNFAEIIGRYADNAIKSQFLPEMTAGRLTGAMALTEPDFGSDLANIRTRAVKNDAGQYLITGTKRFITHGCGVGQRPALILTLARSGGAGARGLSLFLVRSTDVTIGGIERKLGLHSSPTCEVILENTPALLIGEEGRGLVRYAMGMMNYARVNVAVQALGLAQAALVEADKYARAQAEARTATSHQAPLRRNLEEMDSTVQALRALIYRTAETVDLLEGRTGILADRGVDERSIRKDPEVLKWSKLADVLTPVCKFFASEQANRVAGEAICLAGPPGCRRESTLARIFLDVRITTIYEGTSQLMVLAAIGGITEGMQENGILLRYLNGQISLIENDRRSALLRRILQELLDSLAVYRLKSAEAREAVALDVVWHFGYFFCLLLLALQAEQAPPEFRAMKEKACGVFEHIAAGALMRLPTVLGINF